jgi:nucleoside-triphosphatase
LTARPTPVLLLTGRPGVGKTTVLRRVAGQLGGRRLAGFYTEEIRDGGRRLGFRAVPFRGAPRDMARVDFPGPARVSRYGVDVAVIEALVRDALEPSRPADLCLIDEIGKMECLAPAFVAAVRAWLGAGRPVIATVARTGGGLIAEVKARPGAVLWEVTRGNRDALPGRVLAWLGEVETGGGPPR